MDVAKKKAKKRGTLTATTFFLMEWQRIKNTTNGFRGIKNNKDLSSPIYP
jgi:hypothetical protein